MPSTAASMYLLCLSSVSPGSASRMKTGSRFRARIATPFQERSPFQTAWYPAFRIASIGKVAVRAFQFLQAHDVWPGGREPSQQV